MRVASQVTIVERKLCCDTSRGGDGVSDSTIVISDRADRVLGRSATWPRSYRRQVAVADFGVAVMAAVVAVGLRFGSHPSTKYLLLSVLLPPLWLVALRFVGGYEMRFLGTGSDEFHRVLNAGVSLTAALVLISYTVNDELSRAYLVISMPVIVLLDVLARFTLRKRLHRRRAAGLCMSTVVAVGHEAAVADLISELRREPLPRPRGGRRLHRGRRHGERGGRHPGGGRSRRRRRGRGPRRRGHGGGAVLPGDGRRAGCGSWPGSWRRPVPTCASRPRCSTWPGRAPRSGRPRA